MGGNETMAAFTLDNETLDPEVNIKVVGVGGGGGNALNCMAEAGITDIEYIAVNTDAAALRNSKATTKIQIGQKLTKGRGAGNKPEIGRGSAEENREEIEAALKGATMVFVTAGMGGGTGTGAAPVVAEIAKGMDILTVAVVTKPFLFEREQKMRQAESGIEELKQHVDSLVIIPNERLLTGKDKLTMKECFGLSDDVLKTSVKSVKDLVIRDGKINLDFADVSTVMKDAGVAHMAVGVGKGDKKAEEAAKAVISSPLLETSIAGAKRLLVNVICSEDIAMDDVTNAVDLVSSAADKDVQFIFGTCYDPSFNDEICLTVIATEFENAGMHGGSISPGVIKVDNPLLGNTQNLPVPGMGAQPVVPPATGMDSGSDDLLQLFKMLDKNNGDR